MHKILYIFLLFISITISAIEEENPEVVKYKEFLELNNKTEDIIKLEGMQLEVNKGLSLLKNVQISLNSKTVSITNTTIFQLDVHPEYSTKIFLPQGANILNFDPSTAVKGIWFKWNKAKIQMLPDFISCSIDLTFEYEKKIYDITIIAEKYNISKKNNRDNIFYPKIILTLEKPLSPSEVLKLYKKCYGELPKKKATYFTHKEIIYKIEYDDFKAKNPMNDSNVEVIYENNIYKYKVTNGLNRT